MSLYALDTDTFSLYVAGHPVVRQRCQARPPAELAVTVITVEEQLAGWFTALRRARRRDQTARAYRRLAQTVQELAGWQILPFPEPAIDRFERLRRLRLKVASNDLRIAAVVLEFGGILVTRNLRDF